MYLIGDSVLRSAYMVFDMGQNRVGLAANKGLGGVVALNTTSSTNSSADTSNTQSLGVGSFEHSFYLTLGALGVTALTMIAL
jgi:hypothetical protein